MPTDNQKRELNRLQTEGDDDDFDEFDDVLGEFDQSVKSVPSAPPPSATTATAPTTIGNRPRHNTRVDAPPISIPGSGPKFPVTEEEENLDEDELRDDFASELAKGMEELMMEITNGIATGDKTGSSSDVAAGSGSGDGEEMTDEERTRTFKAAWEAMLVEGLNGADDGGLGDLGQFLDEDGVKPKSTSEVNPATTNDFKARIQQAMNKLKESESSFRPDSSSASPGDIPDSFEALLKSLDGIGLGENDEGDAEFTNFLENMMGQLMSKEVLYDPLKELATNFPEYLAKPPKPLNPADKERYEQQYSCIQQIIVVFEKPDYSDTNPVDNQTIVNLMTKMQTYGQPPSELLGELPPGIDGKLPRPGDDCVIT